MDGSLTLRDRRNLAAGVSDIYLKHLVTKAAEYFRDRNYDASLRYFDEVL